MSGFRAKGSPEKLSVCLYLSLRLHTSLSSVLYSNGGIDHYVLQSFMNYISFSPCFDFVYT